MPPTSEMGIRHIRPLGKSRCSYEEKTGEEGGAVLRDIDCRSTRRADSALPLKHRHRAPVAHWWYFWTGFWCCSAPTPSPSTRVALLTHSSADVGARCSRPGCTEYCSSSSSSKPLPHTGTHSATTPKTNPNPLLDKPLPILVSPPSHAQVGHLFLKRSLQFANLVPGCSRGQSGANGVQTGARLTTCVAASLNKAPIQKSQSTFPSLSLIGICLPSPVYVDILNLIMVKRPSPHLPGPFDGVSGLSWSRSRQTRL